MNNIIYCVVVTSHDSMVINSPVDTDWLLSMSLYVCVCTCTCMLDSLVVKSNTLLNPTTFLTSRSSCINRLVSSF